MKKIALLILFILSYLLTDPFMNYFKINLIEPNFKSYRSDEDSFIKTLYLMDRGKNYYQAFKEARQNLSGGVRINNEALTYRLPTIFYLWNLLIKFSPSFILTFFIYLSMLWLISIFLIARKVTDQWLAVISSVILIPYLYDTFAYRSAFLFIEWWGLFFFTYGLTAYFYEKKKTAILFLTLAICTRELFIIPVFLLLVFNMFKRKNIKIYMIPVLFFLTFYLIHYILMTMTLGPVSSSFLGRIHPFSKINLLHMISFSMRAYVIGGFKTHYLLVLFGLMSVLLNSVLYKSNYFWTLVLIIIGFLVVLPTISIAEDDYWGIIFIPFILMSIPFILNPRKLIK